jgi:hypothetical protein
VGGVGVAAETLQARGVAAAGRAFLREIHRGNPSGNPSDLCGIYVDWNLWLGDRIFWFYGTFMGGNWITDIHSIWDKYGYFLGQWNIHGAMAMQSLSPNLHRLGCHHVTMVDVGDET